MSENVCRFFLNGSCRFGDNCRYIHPDGGRTSPQSYSRKGDYYVSDNNRSLWRTDFRSDSGGKIGHSSNKVNFSFNQALQNQTKTTNRYESLSDIEIDDPRDYRDEWSDHSRSDYRKDGNVFGIKSTFSKSNNDGNYGFGGLNQNQPSQFSLSHLSSKNVSNKYDGLFRPKSAQQKQTSIQEAASNFSFAPKQIQRDSAFRNDSNMMITVPNDNFPASSTPNTLFGKPVQTSYFGGKSSPSVDFQSSKTDVVKSVLSESKLLEKYHCNVFSKIENLSVSEKTFYIADVFKLGEIPTKPPPQELCY